MADLPAVELTGNPAADRALMPHCRDRVNPRWLDRWAGIASAVRLVWDLHR